MEGLVMTARYSILVLVSGSMVALPNGFIIRSSVFGTVWLGRCQSLFAWNGVGWGLVAFTLGAWAANLGAAEWKILESSLRALILSSPNGRKGALGCGLRIAWMRSCAACWAALAEDSAGRVIFEGKNSTVLEIRVEFVFVI
jgi:hypothetical protein